jgi:UDP-glucuronate 4-epimerase
VSPGSSVGSTLARRLLHEGHDVVGVDVLTDHYGPRLKRENLRVLEQPRLRVVEADL